MQQCQERGKKCYSKGNVCGVSQWVVKLFGLGWTS